MTGKRITSLLSKNKRFLITALDVLVLFIILFFMGENSNDVSNEINSYIFALFVLSVCSYYFTSNYIELRLKPAHFIRVGFRDCSFGLLIVVTCAYMLNFPLMVAGPITLLFSVCFLLTRGLWQRHLFSQKYSLVLKPEWDIHALEKFDFDHLYIPQNLLIDLDPLIIRHLVVNGISAQVTSDDTLDDNLDNTMRPLSFSEIYSPSITKAPDLLSNDNYYDNDNDNDNDKISVFSLSEQPSQLLKECIHITDVDLRQSDGSLVIYNHHEHEIGQATQNYMEALKSKVRAQSIADFTDIVILSKFTDDVKFHPITIFFEQFLFLLCSEVLTLQCKVVRVGKTSDDLEKITAKIQSKRQVTVQSPDINYTSDKVFNDALGILLLQNIPRTTLSVPGFYYLSQDQQLNSKALCDELLTLSGIVQREHISFENLGSSYVGGEIQGTAHQYILQVETRKIERKTFNNLYHYIVSLLNENQYEAAVKAMFTLRRDAQVSSKIVALNTSDVFDITKR